MQRINLQIDLQVVLTQQFDLQLDLQVVQFGLQIRQSAIMLHQQLCLQIDLDLQIIFQILICKINANINRKLQIFSRTNLDLLRMRRRIGATCQCTCPHNNHYSAIGASNVHTMLITFYHMHQCDYNDAATGDNY